MASNRAIIPDVGMAGVSAEPRTTFQDKPPCGNRELDTVVPMMRLYCASVSS